MPLSPFDQTIAPLSSDEFFSRYWGRAHLLQKGSADRYANILPWSELNRVMERQPASLKLAKEGALLPEHLYRDVHSTRRPLRSSDVAAQLEAGATLIIDNIHHEVPAIRAIAESLELACGERVHVNLYAGWGTSRGFDLHWDDHDVLILHLHGRKAWKVYGMSRPHPVTADRYAVPPVPAPATPLWDGLLEPGDLLYLPRGWWHVATALAEPTLHLTFSIPRQTGLDFLQWLSSRLVDEEIFRRDLPRLDPAEERLRHFTALKAALVRCLETVDLDDFLRDHDLRSAPRALFSLPSQATRDPLPPGDDFPIRSLLRHKPEIVHESGQPTLTLLALNRKFTFSAATADTLHLIFNTHETRFSELRRHTAAHVGDDALRNFLRKLSQHGLVALG